MQVYLTTGTKFAWPDRLETPAPEDLFFARDNGLDTVRNMKNLMLTQS